MNVEHRGNNLITGVVHRVCSLASLCTLIFIFECQQNKITLIPMKQNISVAIIYTNGVLISSPKWEDWIFSSLKINFNIQLYICKIIKEGDKWRTYIIYKKYIYIHCCCFSVPSHVPLFVTSWTIAHQVLLSLTISLSSSKFMSIELMMPSNHLILCSPFLLLPSVFPSISVFSNEFDLHISWPKHWSFSFSLSNEYSELIPLGLTGLILQSKRL